MGSIGLFLFVTMFHVLQADDPAALMVRAQQAYTAKDYAKCAELYVAAVKTGGTGSTTPYNAACCHALAGNTGEAFVWLTKAIQAGWRDVDHLKKDSDLTSLHSDERWAQIIKRCEKAAELFAKSLIEPALREELLKRMKEDQRIRMEGNPDMEEWGKIDADNTAYMKTVIDKHGWPGKSMVGEDGALAAFLMVQHADADPEFQKKCLPLLEAAVQAKEASAGHFAYLTDRVLLAEGKPQRYGSQFQTVDGKFVPLPLEDPDNVDARRLTVGLPPLAEYARQMESLRKRTEEDFAKSVKKPALREELVRRMEETQRVSNSSDAAAKDKLDADTAYIKTVIAKHGWPGDSLVGWDGANAAFILVLRAEADLDFQKKCLPLLEAAVKAKEASPDCLAQLTDRILLAEGKPQRYGTQFHTVDGELVPRPIEDPDNVDARRQSLGLPPMAELTRQMKSLQRKDVEKK